MFCIHRESPVNAWTWVRLALAVVLCLPIGIIALVYLLLALKASSRVSNSDNESYNKREKLVNVANVLILIGIIVGSLCFAAAGIAFGLITSNSGGGCVNLSAYRCVTEYLPDMRSDILNIYQM